MQALKPVKGLRTKRHHCCYCEMPLNPGQATKEHIIPKHSGGRIIQPACKACNWEKGPMTLEVYLAYLLYLVMAYRLRPDDARKLRRTRVKIKNVTKFLKLLYPGEWDYL